MRQFINFIRFGLLSIVFFASCVLEDKRPEDEPAMAGPDIRATYESGADTRTVLETNEEGKGSQYWLPEEQISVFFNGKPALYTSTNKENASEAVFSTTDMLEYADIHSGNIWGLYPSDDTAECDGVSVTTSIPDSQKALPGTFDTNLFPLLAHSSTTDLAFYNVCGGIKFSLDKDNVYKIILKGNSGENLAGKVKLSFPSSGRPQAEVLEGKTTITLTPKNSGTFKKNQNYYLVCLPVTFSQGFEMTFYSTDGKMATYKRQDPVTIKRAVFSRKASIDQYVSGWEDNPDMTGGKRSGLYLGITGFNQALYNYPISRLNEVTISDYYSFVNGIQMKNGSLLCYSVDQSINRLQDAIFPDDLCAVALVTFTDGLDQGSVMMNPSFSSDEEYLDSIHSRIVNEKVAGHSILAYSVGLKGMDVSDVSKFRYNLRQLASESGNAFEVNDMSEVNGKLQQIAQNVTDISNIYDIAMTIPGQSNGTRVRFTFDRVSDATSSSTYIEGTFRLSDYSLRDVTYHGLTSFSGSTITGTVNGIFITYSFQGIQKDTGGTINKSDIAQWSYITSTGRWQKNSEFDASQDADVVVKKQSVAVMLVLDCSSSLGSQYSTMQSHARSFIKTLQEASYDPYAVSSVSLNSTSLSLYVGNTRQLTATVSPSSAKDKTVTWVSFNPSAVQVDQTGLITALDVGESDVVVTTTDGGYTAACKVTVKPILVTSITLDKTSLTLNEGETASLTATIKPDNATYKTPSWTSSDESVATVDENGEVTAVSKGTATIKASAIDDSGKYASCKVTVNRVVSSIELDNTSLTIHVGESATLTATVEPESATNTGVTWTSSNTAVATVTSAGVVTGKAKGEATITVAAKDGSGLSAECAVSVLTAVPEIVDLGLSVKWASFNLGAQKPEDDGNYYAWGEVETKSEFSWLNYKWCNGSGQSLIKYCNNASYGFNGYTDRKTVLEPEDDIAHVDLGGNWRIPTKGEFEELLNHCSKTRVSYNGKTGYKFTSKVAGFTDKSIFLPMVGYKGTSVRGYSIHGHYRSSSLYTEIPNRSWELFLSTDDAITDAYDHIRCFGRSVRPVYGEYTPVESVILDKAASVIWVGESMTLNATVSPSDATDKSVTWSSSNTAVATVSSSGVVTAKSVGNATISVTTTDGLKTATCAVEVRQKVTSVTLNKTSLSLNEGESSTLTATVKPDNAYDKTVVWTSSDTSVAKVDGNGKVTSVSKGSATITATANDGSGKYATCSVTVKRLVSSIELDKTSLTLNVNESATLTATVLPATANNKTVSWSSSNSAVATVSSSGEVTGKAKGVATITATAKDGSGVSASCAVEVKQPVTSITLGQTSLSLNEGESAVLTPTVSPENANDKSVTWSSSDTSVAKVDGNGKVTAVSKGTATITATANDGSGKYATCSVTVIRLVSSIELDKTSLTLNVNENATLTATVWPQTANNTGITWSSSNTSVVTVSSSGVVTGKYKGEAVITVTADDGSGITAECAVSVVIAVPETVDMGLSVKWASFNLGASKPEEYGDYYAWGETEPKEKYSWSTYKFGTRSIGPFSKYNTKSSYGSIDDKTVLEPEDDVAHVKLGGNWRMPTDEEWTELRTKCTWTWVTSYNRTGINGRLVTATNGNSIFLPAAGRRYDSDLNYAGSYGGYWSSSLNTDYPYDARNVYFYYDNVYRYYYNRFYGLSVRPVSE